MTPLKDIRPIVKQKADFFAGKRRKQEELGDFILSLLNLKGITCKVSADVYVQDTDNVEDMEFRCTVKFEHITPFETQTNQFSLAFDPYRSSYLLLESGGGTSYPVVEVARSERFIVQGRFIENYAAHERAILSKFTKDPEFKTCCSLQESVKYKAAAAPLIADRNLFITTVTAVVQSAQGKGRIRIVNAEGKQVTVPVVKGTITFNQQFGEGMRLIVTVNGKGIDIPYATIHQWGQTPEGYKFITSTGDTFLFYTLS